MTRRICLVTVANDILGSIAERLPENIQIAAVRECFDRSCAVLRLTGLGLPEWCNEPPHGGQFATAMITYTEDGGIQFTRGAIHVPHVLSRYEMLMDMFDNMN